jgi:branched-chain amino acid aminotransferase
MMNHTGKVSEGSGMNIFVVRDGIIYTPGVDQDILEGITRKSVIDMARHLGYTVIERPVDKTELLIADEVFFTGTAARITPVKRIESYDLPDEKPVCGAIRACFDRIFDGQEPTFSHWMEEISW